MQYAKVGEYQRRGLIHFHALIRLDGPRPTTGSPPPPTGSTPPPCAPWSRRLRRRSVHRAALFDDDVPRVLAFGVQVDVRVVRSTTAPTTRPGAVRRSRSPGTWRSTRPSPPPTPPRTPTPTRTCAGSGRSWPRPPGRRRRSPRRRHLDADEVKALPYGLLGKWSTCSGSAGTSRPSPAATRSPSGAAPRPSTVPGPGRRRRPPRRSRRRPGSRGRLLADDDDETTLVIGSWEFAGTGWDTEGDVDLARAAAARAREYAQHRAAVEAHESAVTSNGSRGECHECSTGRSAGAGLADGGRGGAVVPHQRGNAEPPAVRTVGSLRRSRSASGASGRRRTCWRGSTSQRGTGDDHQAP